MSDGSLCTVVVVGVDGSESSWNALWWACGETRRRGGRVVAALVSPSPSAAASSTSSPFLTTGVGFESTAKIQTDRVEQLRRKIRRNRGRGRCRSLLCVSAGECRSTAPRDCPSSQRRFDRRGSIHEVSSWPCRFTWTASRRKKRNADHCGRSMMGSQSREWSPRSVATPGKRPRPAKTALLGVRAAVGTAGDRGNVRSMHEGAAAVPGGVR